MSLNQYVYRDKESSDYDILPQLVNNGKYCILYTYYRLSEITYNKGEVVYYPNLRKVDI